MNLLRFLFELTYHAHVRSFFCGTVLLASFGEHFARHHPLFYFVILLADKVICNSFYSTGHVILPRGPCIRPPFGYLNPRSKPVSFCSTRKELDRPCFELQWGGIPSANAIRSLSSRKKNKSWIWIHNAMRSPAMGSRGRISIQEYPNAVTWGEVLDIDSHDVWRVSYDGAQCAQNLRLRTPSILVPFLFFSYHPSSKSLVPKVLICQH